MAYQRIYAVYFSPTGGTENVVRILARTLCESSGLPCEEIDFTLPAARVRRYRFGPRDLVVIGSPVYAGRIPNKILPDWKNCFSAEGAAAVPVVVYGNRSEGGALAEFCLLLRDAGFSVAGGAAIVSRHAFTDALAYGRPDEADREEIRSFAGGILEKLKVCPAGTKEKGPDLPGQARIDSLLALTLDEIPAYYTPKKEDGTPAVFLKAKPETDPNRCACCGTCRRVCPMGAVNDSMQAEGVCIKCQACVRKCPNRAKYFSDEEFLSHVRMLEKNYTGRADNHFML